jgi:hypothetical protein
MLDLYPKGRLRASSIPLKGGTEVQYKKVA